MKLGLGTVQFGTDYGISNSQGRTPAGEVARILGLARELGIAILDTAPLYGDSEEVLGASLGRDHAFRVVTKTLKFGRPAIGTEETRDLIESFHRSLERLRVTSVHGLMIHDSQDLLKPGGDHLMRAMEDLRASGAVTRIGASVYTGAQIDSLMARFHLDILQVPVNVLDQRLLHGGQLDRLRAAGCEVHARSAFLQGALLMDPEALPPHFESIREHLRAWRAYLAEMDLTPQRAALGFVAGLAQVDVVVCGVNTVSQLAELGASCLPLPGGIDFSPFAIEEDRVLNPSLWRI